MVSLDWIQDYTSLLKAGATSVIRILQTENEAGATSVIRILQTENEKVRTFNLW